MGLRRQTYSIKTSSNITPEDILGLAGISTVRHCDGYYDAVRGWQISFIAQNLVGRIDCHEDDGKIYLYY